ncbi:hypothetical protein HanRHA438_Chr13g0588571 [Helianthus annuus]|uniref:Uncharacterized protein n=1 Tax=Helianthus annuus TaxID=4232 RepID=A0A9K3HAR7_HELAN|nr:hypothetical protein HanXRQr2_Chr13g0577801 [Helianthus annuus]KAJ0480200.1 hypothetical protein HanIR_Chr13g0628801 [Helianthus annuus]KAJ0857311.1 hypothetical protein HanRHA438_Chr13g0588571 [Helianthus annuus]
MLDHEIMFKNQEMHRLYAVQKLLKGASNYPRCELFPMKRTFTESHPVGPSQFMFDQDFGSRFQQRSLDLRLSIGNSCDDDVLDREELNLSLSIGMSSNKRIKTSRKSMKNTIVYPSSPVIIDLEDSTETGSNESLKANLHQDELFATSLKMNGEMHHECSDLNQGSNGWNNVKRTILVDIDLNKDQPDENPSWDGSCGESSSQLATSLTFKGQTKTCTIDLESLPEPSSDLTEEKIISVSEASIQDFAEENAALSLISISKQLTLTANQDSVTSDETENQDEKKKKTTTRSLSIDSYESLVLKLEESSIEEDSATSKAYEINENELDQKDNGIKLRRGRRLKDFQKDILPTLSSLSKHEIWEDIKLLEGVIRSREYKRLNKAKTLTTVKSKRAKVNASGQKACSQKRKL